MPGSARGARKERQMDGGNRICAFGRNVLEDLLSARPSQRSALREKRASVFPPSELQTHSINSPLA